MTAQHAEGDDLATATGMVDRLSAPDFALDADQIAYATAYLAPGDLDAILVARLRDPEAMAARERKAADLRARDWPALGRYRRENAALADRAVNVVFIGDSLTEMWGVAQPDLFTGGIVNRGISGQTSPQILLRFMADVVTLKPRVVHLLCGTNDIASNTGPTTPQDYRNNVLAMLALAQAHGIQVVLGGLLPVIDLPWVPAVTNAGARIAELNLWLAQTAQDRGLVFADYHPALAADTGAMRGDLTRDGVHPVIAGYQIMRPIAEAAVAAAWAKT
ncbi:hypothetical protein BH10PSE2_BH10PSE2_15780 [soil metagenome]